MRGRGAEFLLLGAPLTGLSFVSTCPAAWVLLLTVGGSTGGGSRIYDVQRDAIQQDLARADLVTRGWL